MSLPIVEPSQLGLSDPRWRKAVKLAEELCLAGRVPALAMQFVRPDGATAAHAFGNLKLSDVSRRLEMEAGQDEEASVSDVWLPTNAIFLTASLTKPIVAMGVLKLVEQGRLALNDRVQDYIPEFSDPPKRPITIRHLLTHTSGLPDQLPNNRSLRQSRAPLPAFIEGTCGVTLDFPCGRGTQYQSLGFALLGEIVQRATGASCATLLREEIFRPLDMTDTSLGAPEEWFTGPRPAIHRIPEINVPDDQAGGDDWNWNSRYWRTLGVPWGGMLSTAGDLSRFLAMMLNRGRLGEVEVFAPATVEAATTNQLDDFHDVPEADRRSRAWGYGWRMNWKAHPAAFCDLLTADVCGHWGATGTMMWLDPRRQAALVLLTTQPLDQERSDLIRVSNAVAAAMRE